MLIKPTPAPADPTKVCKTCGHYDPTLQICCARDMLITKADAEQWTCGDWEEKLNVLYVSETIGMTPVNPAQEERKEPENHSGVSLSIDYKPFAVSPGDDCCSNCGNRKWCSDVCKPLAQKIASVYTTRCGAWVNDTRSFDTLRCESCEHHNPLDFECKKRDVYEEGRQLRCRSWEQKSMVACDTVPLQPDGSLKMKASETIGARIVNPVGVTKLTFGGTSLKELEEKQKADELEYAKRRKALDYGAKQGMTLEALDTVFAIACQQMPSMEQRWMELRAEINVMFAQKWAAEDMPE